ncbi:sigma-70 family RNA polymerase sigma factor [Candidatus Curtissbacteria bacterium]|nr:sigma-70 family RNA polymerase sigma factor [Candidatus Curtissbacteria bacterium]
MRGERLAEGQCEYYMKEMDQLFDEDCDQEEMRERLGKKIITGRKALFQLIELGSGRISKEDRGVLIRQGLMEKNLVRRVLNEARVNDRERLELALNEAMGAVDDFVEQYLPLVISIAKKYVGNGIDFMDLVQDGNIGLMKAAAKYDYKRAKFITHASWWIRQTIIRSFQNNANTIRISSDSSEKRRLIKKMASALEQEGIPVTERGVAMKSGLSRRTIRRISALPKTVSLDGLGTVAQAARNGRETEAAVEAEMLIELMAEIFDYLPSVSERLAEVLVIRHYETDEGGEVLPMKDIGVRLGGVTRQWVQLLLKNAYRILKDDEVYGPQLREWLYE